MNFRPQPQDFTPVEDFIPARPDMDYIDEHVMRSKILSDRRNAPDGVGNPRLGIDYSLNYPAGSQGWFNARGGA